MAYEKTNWVNGMTQLNASNMNHIEDGIYTNSQDIEQLREDVHLLASNFRGNWNDWEDVPTNVNDYPEDEDGNKTPTNNDYLIIKDASDYTGETLEGTWRFSYTGTWTEQGKNGWLPEYQVNETPLTDEQLAALNSGITSELVTQIGTNASDIITKQDKLIIDNSDNITLTIDNLSKIKANLVQNQYTSRNSFPATGSSKILYVDLSDNSLWIYNTTQSDYIKVGKTKTSELVNDGDGQSYQEHVGYQSFNSTTDYIDYYVLISTVYTLVTEDNKDTLNITPGTTKAYEFSPFATEQYVKSNGGKIDSISVNNTPQTIDTNKNVNITVPTQASDVNALPDSTKYGANLSVNGTTVQLLDQDGNNLGNSITTQDTGATSVGLNTGDTGNVITNMTYDPSTRKITFEKGETFVKTSDVDNALSTSSTNPVQNKVIAELIPAQASSSNQLADKNFVNSSISTNTANFIGTFANVTTLNGYSGTVTNNDYANVTNQELDFETTTAMNNYDKTLLTNYDYAWVENGAKYDLYRFDIIEQTWGIRATNISKGDVSLITAYNRYVYNGTTNEWMWNYTVNTSGFTAVQWAAINSGVTTSDITKLSGIENGAQVNEVTDVKVDNVSILSSKIADIKTKNSNYNASTNKFVTESDLSEFQTTSNLVTSIDSTSTDAQYPSAKLLYDQLALKSGKSTITDYTLTAANWSNNTYTLSVTGKTSSNHALVSNSNTGTDADVLANTNAIADANIYKITDNGTSLTFVCETTPTVDLKIQVEVYE